MTNHYPLHVIVYGNAGNGKAQPLDRYVLTPTGWTTIGALQPGDVLFAANGTQTSVVAIRPQGVRPVFTVTFSDGATTESCAEHLWLARTASEVSHKTSPSPRTLHEIMAKGVRLKGKDMRRKWGVPYCAPVQFAPTELLIEPYLLGVLIGDDTLHQGSILLTTPERDVVNRAFAGLWDGDEVVQQTHDTCATYRIKRRQRNNTRSTTAQYIQQLGLDVRSPEKFVPKPYLFSSVSQRRALLAGLLDTDGHCQGGQMAGNFEYSTTSEQLARDVQFLVRSLGGFASCRRRASYYTKASVRKRVLDSYRVFLSFPGQQDCPAFSDKHRARFRPRAASWHQIDNIMPSREVETTCIQVAHPSGLYLTDDFIVTHNSTLAATFPKPLLVQMWDPIGKERAYMTQGPVHEITEEPVDERGNTIRVTNVKSAKGKLRVRIEHYLSTDPEAPEAFRNFRNYIGTLNERIQQYAIQTLVTDSVTFMELAKRKEEQYVLNAVSNRGNKADGRQWYAASMNALEDHIMIRMAALPINVVVIAHINELKDDAIGNILYNPAAPGQLGKKMPAAYSELYRAHVSRDLDGERHYVLQTQADNMFNAGSSIPAPDGCDNTYAALWSAVEAEDKLGHLRTN